MLLVSTYYYIDSRNSFVTIGQTEGVYRPKFVPFQPSNRSTNQVPEENFTLQILYLTQTENCLPEYLLSPEVIGNTTACQCDVLVLSYKEPCKDTSLPHVKYIFQPSSTWTTGRNLLYEISKVRDKFYLYYIFMDDDVKLHAFDRTLTNRNLWRMFEHSLRTIQPPIATIMDSHLKFLDVTRPKDCEPEHVTKFAQVFWFDAIFCAFHNQAVDHILPYRVKFDSRSWYYSQIYAIIRSDVIFHGQVVGDTRIQAQNTQHHPYPKEHNWNTFIVVADDVRNEIPAKYRNRSEPIILKWMKNYYGMQAVGEFYCSRPLKPNTIQSYSPYNV